MTEKTKFPTLCPTCEGEGWIYRDQKAAVQMPDTGSYYVYNEYIRRRCKDCKNTGRLGGRYS